MAGNILQAVLSKVTFAGVVIKMMVRVTERQSRLDWCLFYHSGPCFMVSRHLLSPLTLSAGFPQVSGSLALPISPSLACPAR